MIKIKSIKGIDSDSLPQLKRVLLKFLLLNHRIAREWEWKDFPWWYNERASLSVLAAAAWKSNGIAFEEFSNPKRRRKIGHAQTYNGRSDLYIKVRNKEFTIEAKNMFVNAFPRNSDTHVIIKRKLLQAVKDVKKARTYGTNRLAVLFVVPRFNWTEREHLEILIDKWIREIKKVKPTAAAWTFPKESRIKSRWKSKRLFPGVAILIKKV